MPVEPDRLRGLRVAIVQPALPKYRVPVFDTLAREWGLRLTVAAEFRPIWGSLASERGPGSFATVDAPITVRAGFFFQPMQVTLAREGEFDCIIYNWNRRFVHLDRALRIARRRGIGTILWGHGFSKSESALRRFLRNRLLRKADAGLLYSHRTAQALAAEGVDPSRLFVAQNAVDHTLSDAAIARWRADPARLERFAVEHGLAAGQLVVFISRVEPDKRVDLLVDAFSRLVQRRPQARLVVIGGGSALEDAKRQAEAAGVRDGVHFTGPLYDEDAIAPWCMLGGCFAYPAAIGLSIHHAFAYALPVVTGDDLASHNPEIEALEPGVNGLLFRSGDASDLAATLGRLLEERELRERLQAGARRTIDRPGGFTVRTMCEGFAEAIAAVTRR